MKTANLCIVYKKWAETMFLVVASDKVFCLQLFDSGETTNSELFQLLEYSYFSEESRRLEGDTRFARGGNKIKELAVISFLIMTGDNKLIKL